MNIFGKLRNKNIQLSLLIIGSILLVIMALAFSSLSQTPFLSYNARASSAGNCTNGIQKEIAGVGSFVAMANCGNSCTGCSGADCQPSKECATKYGGGASSTDPSSYWCYGFDNGFKCLVKYSSSTGGGAAPTATSAPAPTAAPAGGGAANPGKCVSGESKNISGVGTFAPFGNCADSCTGCSGSDCQPSNECASKWGGGSTSKEPSDWWCYGYTDGFKCLIKTASAGGGSNPTATPQPSSGGGGSNPTSAPAPTTASSGGSTACSVGKVCSNCGGDPGHCNPDCNGGWCNGGQCSTCSSSSSGGSSGGTTGRTCPNSPFTCQKSNCATAGLQQYSNYSCGSLNKPCCGPATAQPTATSQPAQGAQPTTVPADYEEGPTTTEIPPSPTPSTAASPTPVITPTISPNTYLYTQQSNNSTEILVDTGTSSFYAFQVTVSSSSALSKGNIFSQYPIKVTVSGNSAKIIGMSSRPIKGQFQQLFYINNSTGATIDKGGSQLGSNIPIYLK